MNKCGPLWIQAMVFACIIYAPGGAALWAQDNRTGAESIRDLIAKLKDGDQEARTQVRNELRKRGVHILSELETARRETNDETVREQLTHVIRKLQDDVEEKFIPLITEVYSVRQSLELWERFDQGGALPPLDVQLRYRDIPGPDKLKELLQLRDDTFEKVRKTREEFDAARREIEPRVTAIIHRWMQAPNDPVESKELMLQDYPVLSREWAKEKALIPDSIAAIHKHLNRREAKAFNQALEDILGIKIYKLILPHVLEFYSGRLDAC